MTSAKGEEGCAKSASECTGWRVGGDEGRAELAEMNESLGFGPKTEEVICVAIGFRKISGSKYVFDNGGSCWMFLGLSAPGYAAFHSLLLKYWDGWMRYGR